MNEYKKMLKITKAILKYGTDGLINGEIIYINGVKHLQVNYTDKEKLFIEID